MGAAEPAITQQSPDETPDSQYSATYGFLVNTGFAFLQAVTQSLMKTGISQVCHHWIGHIFIKVTILAKKYRCLHYGLLTKEASKHKND